MVDNWYVNKILEALGHGHVCTITCVEAVILIEERLCSPLVQELSSQVIPGLRCKEGKCKCG